MLYIISDKGFIVGMYVLTIGAIPLLLAILIFAYCSKNHHSSSNWNKSNRKMLSYVSKKKLHNLVIDGGNSNSYAYTTTITRPLPSINTVSFLVTQNDNGFYSEPSEANNFYHNNMSEPIYDTILENAYVNKVCSVPQSKYNDAKISQLKKSDIVITTLKSTTNPQVKSYLQDGVWRDSK